MLDYRQIITNNTTEETTTAMAKLSDSAPAAAPAEDQDETDQAPPAQAKAPIRRKTRVRAKSRSATSEKAEAVDTTAGGLFAPLTSRREFVKAMLYGREGTGKSTAAAQASKLGRVLFIDAEGGLKTESLRSLGADPDNIMVWPTDNQPITAERLEQLHRELMALLDDDPDALHTIVFDSLTEIHHLLREQATDYRVQTSRIELDPDYIDRNDYGRMTNQLRKLIRRFRDLPAHVVFLALEREDDDGDGGRREVRPALTAALCVDVLGYVDVVGRFGSADDTYRARFRGVERVRAKDRYNILPDQLHQPGLDRILAWINGELTADNDPVQQEMLERDAARRKEAERKAAEVAARKQRVAARAK